MNADEKAKILVELVRGREALLGAVDGVGEDAGARAPGPGKWSVLECVEHLAIAEEHLLAQMTRAQKSETPAIDPARESRIAARAADRTRPVASPDQGKPTGRFASLEQALAAFSATRQRTIGWVEECTDDPRLLLTSHPLIPTVNCYEMLLMIAAHPLRHVQQIEEIKAALSSPR
ncbi:MAG TPA: DinB family protein [Bryobacteraceae bacterium]|jgi:hypothetical protein